LPKSADVGETIEVRRKVAIVSSYQCQAESGVWNERRNIGAIAGERVGDEGDETDRAFSRVIAGLSIPVRTEPGLTQRAAGGTGGERRPDHSSLIAWRWGRVTLSYLGMSVTDAESPNEGKSIAVRQQVRIVSGYEYRARARVDNKGQNVGAVAGERVRHGAMRGIAPSAEESPSSQ
jgi:hypothetical protein